MTEAATGIATSELPAPPAIRPLSRTYRGYAMSALLLCSIFNYLDRSIVNILAEPIKKELHLKDWQLGLIIGLGFGMLYTLLGLFVARWAERGHRPRIIGVALVIWSGFTVLCGFVQSYSQLLLARIGVGVGEAGCTPPAHSLIVDYVPPERRSSALAFFGMGIPLGTLAGMAFGGIVADTYGWRTAFLVAGAPGLLLAIPILLTLPEPRVRLRSSVAGRSASAPPPTFAQMLNLVRRKPSWWFIGSSYALSGLVYSGVGPFIASFYLRNHAGTLADIAHGTSALLGVNLGPIGFLGVTLGLLGGTAGVLGTWGGGQLADRLGPKDARNLCYLPAAAVFLYALCLVGTLVVPSLLVSLALFVLQSLLITSIYGATFTAWYSLVQPQMRATNSALLLFVCTLAAYALGPLVVGMLSDLYAGWMGHAEGLRWALVSATAIAVVSAYCSLQASRTFPEDMES
jgi:MFS family permease